MADRPLWVWSMSRWAGWAGMDRDIVIKDCSTYLRGCQGKSEVICKKNKESYVCFSTSRLYFANMGLRCSHLHFANVTLLNELFIFAICKHPRNLV